MCNVGLNNIFRSAKYMHNMSTVLSRASHIVLCKCNVHSMSLKFLFMQHCVLIFFFWIFLFHCTQKQVPKIHLWIYVSSNSFIGFA